MVQGRKVRIWMLRKGIKGADMARVVGVSRSYVSHFLAGRKEAPVIRDWLLLQGCPAKYLGTKTDQAA